MHSRILYAASGLCFIAAAGCFTAAGYILGKRQAEKEYYGKLDAELEAARKYYAKLSKREEYANPKDVVDQGNSNHRQNHMEQRTPRKMEEIPEVPQDLEDRYSYFDYRREIPKREGQKAYVISYDEFMENPKDYDQRTVTYFSKDDVVVEENDTPIEDVLGVFGPVALDQFGNGSKDPNIVYVRNDYLSMDFEICYDPDSFEETVVGHIKHGEKRKNYKFRIDDD